MSEQRKKSKKKGSGPALENILELMQKFGIPYHNRPLRAVLESLAPREAELRKGLQPTYAPMMAYSLRQKFETIRNTLSGLEKWPYGKDKVCPELLADVLHPKPAHPETVFDFERLSKEYGITKGRKSIGALIEETRAVLEAYEDARHEMHYREREFRPEYFSKFPFLLNKYSDWLFIDYTFGFEISELSESLISLEKIKEILT